MRGDSKGAIKAGGATRIRLFLLASELILLSLALIVLGLDVRPVLEYVGLAALGVAMWLLLATRWATD